MWILKENNGFKIVFKYCTMQHNFTLKYKIKPSALTNTGTEYLNHRLTELVSESFVWPIFVLIMIMLLTFLIMITLSVDMVVLTMLLILMF